MFPSSQVMQEKKRFWKPWQQYVCTSQLLQTWFNMIENVHMSSVVKLHLYLKDSHGPHSTALSGLLSGVYSWSWGCCSGLAGKKSCCVALHTSSIRCRLSHMYRGTYSSTHQWAVSINSLTLRVVLPEFCHVRGSFPLSREVIFIWSGSILLPDTEARQ